MANTLSVLIRNVVSKKRRRYTEGGFNLDLAYICDNIIAMGYPGEYIQSVFRNPMNDVCHFFEVTHPEHYKVYNLRSEKAYDVNKFHGRVSVYAFEDHNPPTIELIDKFCNDVDRWLNTDPNNVAAIHCKAGKGRTGTMICCYLLYSGIKTTAEDALAYYGEKRTMNKKGVTIPSQRRYVHYYARLIRSKLKYERRTLQLSEIRFTPATVLQGSVQCSISTMEEIDCTETRTSNISAGTWTKVTVKELDRFPIDFRKTFTLELDEQKVFVTGDVKVELKKIFHFWFNSYFVCDTADYEGEGEDLKLIYTLPKWEIDDAHKDKEHKLFSEDFKVQLVLKPVSPHFHNNDDRSETALLRQHKIHNNHVNSLTTHNANKLTFGSSAIPTSSKSGDPTFDAFHNLIQHPTIERSRKPTSMPPFVPQLQQQQHGGNNSSGGGGIAGGSTNNMHLNHNMQMRHHQQQSQHQKRSSEPTPSVNPESINRSNNKNQNNSSSHYLQQNQQHQQQQQQQLLQQHTHLHHYQHHLHHEQQQQKLVQQAQNQSSQQQQQQQQQNCISSSQNVHNTSSNSNSSSSSSISSQSTSSSSSAGVGGGGGGNEEDWESGESSKKTTTSTTTSTTTTTTTPTTTSYFPYKRLVSQPNDDDDDRNSIKNNKHKDDDDAGVSLIRSHSTTTTTTKSSTTADTIQTNTITTTTTTAISPKCGLPISSTSSSSTFLLPSSSASSFKTLLHEEKPQPIKKFDESLPLSIPLPLPPAPYPSSSSNGLNLAYQKLNITTNQATISPLVSTPIKSRHLNFFHRKCHETPCFSDTCIQKKSPITNTNTSITTTKCTTARDKFLKLINSQRFKAKAISPALGSSLAINCAGNASSSTAASQQLLKKKKVKSKQIPPTKKTFQWLHSYFKVDPDFHENLSQQTTIPMMGRRNSAGSVSGRIHLNSIGSTASGGIGTRAGSVEKGGLLLESKEEDDLHFVGIGPKNLLDKASSIESGEVPILTEYHFRLPTTDSGGELKIIPLGTSPADKAIRNIVDIGTQLASLSPVRDLEFQYDESESLALIKKKNLKCDVPSSSFSNENKQKLPTTMGSKKNLMDDLCVPYSNMLLQSESHANSNSELKYNHDGYYNSSSKCDNNKLSLNNSTTSKCPRSHSDILDLKPAITHQMLLRRQIEEHLLPTITSIAKPVAAACVTSISSAPSSTSVVDICANKTKSDGIVIAKPIEPQSIGFKLEETKKVVSPSPSPSPLPSVFDPPPTTLQTQIQIPPDEDCDVFDSSSTFKATPARRKTHVDSILNLIIVKSDNNSGATNNAGSGCGDVGSTGDTDCLTGGDISPKQAKTGGSSSSSSGYCCASEGSQSISSTSSSGVVDNISSSSTTFSSVERNSLDGGSHTVMVIDSKKKLSLPTPEIEKGAGDIGMTNNRSSSYSYNNHNNFNINNNNNNHSNISTFLESTTFQSASASSLSSSTSSSSIDK
ncbi:serine-rich adhesin for platelets isoform X2 [Episyrphus balteatus]|nr:serine-rich adhesin for platelets isoform X2 [Episyrphus balteatus]